MIKNVLNRFYKTAKKYNFKTIVRLTGDNPLIDPRLVDNYIKFFSKKIMIIYQIAQAQHIQMEWMLRFLISNR